MQRYAQGLKVPKDMLDVFTGKTTDGSAQITCELTYTPKSANHIIIPSFLDVVGNREMRAYGGGLAGNVLTLNIKEVKYQKSDTPTDGGTGGGTGGDPHTHGLSYTNTQVLIHGVIATGLGTIQIHYAVG